MFSRRLFIVNAHPGGNKGAEAMLETVIRQIQSYGLGPDYEIWMEALNNSPIYEIFCQRMGLPTNLFMFQPRRLGVPYDIRPISRDVMIDVGGINYTDKSLWGNIRNFRRHNFFRRSGAKLIFFTQDFGPAQRALTKILARKVLGSATRVLSRSQKSYDLLKTVVPGVPISGPYPDCTLLLPASEPEIQPAAPYVALVPSAIMLNDHGERYMQLMTAIARALPEGITPLILAHNFTPKGNIFDNTVCKDLHVRITSFRSSLLFDHAWTPSALKGLLAGAEAVVTSRFHAMVGAMASGVPTYAIGWNHKYQQFMSPYGISDMTFNMATLADDEAAVKSAAAAIVHEVLSVSSEQRSRMQSVNLEQVALVRASFDELRGLITSG